MAKSEKKLINGPKEVFYAAIGAQKAVYDPGVDKYNAFNAKSKAELEGFIKRGEEVELQIRSKFENFKGSDNLVAKGINSAEEQYQKLVDLTGELTDKVKSFVPVSTEKASVKVKTSAKAKSSARAKASTKAKTPVKRKAAVKKAA